MGNIRATSRVTSENILRVNFDSGIKKSPISNSA